jgi:hypothetical protein
MSGVVAVVTGDGPATVRDVGVALADLLDAGLREIGGRAGRPAKAAAAAVLRELEAPDVLLGVLADGVGHDAMASRLIRDSTKSLAVVPATVRRASPMVISRVLMPLDGTWEAASAVARTSELLAHAGVDLVVLHVFDEATAPRFWDQAAHAREAWAAEFLARYCPHPGVRLELRSGAPGGQVVTAAVEEGADLIALGWSQRLGHDRARTVRRTISAATVPVLLVPVLRVGRAGGVARHSWSQRTRSAGDSPVARWTSSI